MCKDLDISDACDCIIWIDYKVLVILSYMLIIIYSVVIIY